ncbi:hypothetical protein CL658_04490 [bacterium]|nr:hypothetical protein [bacterium]|tara:strand:+ start:2342 stop:3028 length:687 start_codon:yes stop_codon:yes gene_type:complete
MRNIQLAFISVLVALLLHTTIIANQAPLIGKRYFNLSYGMSKQEHYENNISLARLSMNIPITKKLDLGFGSFQGWIEDNKNKSTEKTQHDYSFFTNLKYHFLPQSIINPFILIEIGQVIHHVKNNDPTNEEAIPDSTGLLFANNHKISNSQSSFQYYYSASLGEQLIIKDKTCLSMYYTIGSLNNSNYQHVVANIGYWILRDLLLDFQFKSHINQSINEFHLISHIRF